ncbi:MAG TPA: TMEM175 family protein, partial [Candidatus Eisenbacteria bacterium]
VLWIGHHNQFHYIRRADRPFLWINIFFLMCVGFMPYCTALLGSFIWSRMAAAVYGGALIVTGSVLYVAWRYAAGHGLVSEEVTPVIVRATGNRILAGLRGYALGMAASLLSPPAGLALYVLIPLLYLRRGTIDQHLAARHPHGSH